MKFGKLAFGTLALSGVAFSTSSALAGVSWRAPVNYDHGYITAAATNGAGAGFEVEQHLGGVGGFFGPAPVWDNTSVWGDSGFGAGVDSSGDCTSPSGNCADWQALAGDTGSSSTLFTSAFSFYGSNGNPGTQEPHYIQFRTGYASGSSIIWAQPGTLAQGFYPTIAEATIPGYATQFVEIHNGEDKNQGVVPPTATLFYTTGTLRSDGVTIDWNSQQSFTVGWFASVAMVPMLSGGNATQFLVVDVHQGHNGAGQSGAGPLWVDYGTLTPGSGTIDWLPQTQNYDWGLSPAVAICQQDEGGGASLVEVHNGGTSSVGWYNHPAVSWANGFSVSGWGGNEYDVGEAVYNPHVACTNSWGYETHSDGTTGNDNLFVTKFSLN